MVQVGHACLEAGNRFTQPEKPSHLVLIGVNNEQALHRAVKRAEYAGIRFSIFYEPDDDMGYTCACSEPVSGNQRRIFKHYNLWQTPAATASPRAPPHL